MTKKEYAKLYRQSRRKVGDLTLETTARIKKLYIEAADLAADQVRSAVAAELSDITSDSWSSIEQSLRDGADLISNGTYDQIPKLVRTTNAVQLDINADYMIDAVAKSNSGDILKTAQIRQINSRVNDELVQATVTRQYQDGYTFSDRIFSDKIKIVVKPNGRTVKSYIGMNGDYQYRVKSVIQAGVTQGRDTAQIALDIQEYAFKGKDYVFKAGRYGKLLPGTAEYKKRIAKEIDYRALRLARSEVHASLQQAALKQGDINPAVQDLYDWLLNPTLVHDCVCIDYAKRSPFDGGNVPGYPHPNCGCTVQPHLMDLPVFVDDLAAWANGESIGYLDEWYYNKYLMAG